VATYNVNGLASSIEAISLLCNECDIVFLQELQILPSDTDIINRVHPDFLGFAVSSVDTSSVILRGRPHGGLGVLWRKNIQNITVLHEHADIGKRFIGVKLGSGADAVIFLNVYLPVGYGRVDAVNKYRQAVAAVSTAIGESETGNIIVLGDMNADPSPSSASYRCWAELDNVIESWNLCVADVAILPDDTYTYVSASHDTVSWLDHIAVSEPMLSFISDFRVHLDVTLFDHAPLSCSVTIACDIYRSVRQAKSARTHSRPTATVLWDQSSNEHLRNYCGATEHSLRVLQENSSQCPIATLNSLVTALHNSAYTTLPIRLPESGRRRVVGGVTGWNILTRDKYHEARQAHVRWCQAGRPPSGPICDNRRFLRRAFKNAYNELKQSARRARDERLLAHVNLRDFRSFWKYVRSADAPMSMPSSVDGLSNPDEILAMWRDKFETLYRPEVVTQDPQVVQEPCAPGCEVTITRQDVNDALLRLNVSSAPGLDGLSVRHFLYASNLVLDVIATLFNRMLVTGQVPHQFSDSCVTPILKKRTLDPTNSKNYRPVTLTTCISKIFETVILSRYGGLFNTSDNQFGFKADVDVNAAYAVVHETVRRYNREGSGVFLCFLDATAAFDNVDHGILLDKLRGRGLPPVLLTLFRNWFVSQKGVVRWGPTNALSDSFQVLKGVRQGGVVSPALFSLYVDDMLRCLNAQRVGCFLNNHPMQAVCYADDLVLMAPSRSALQQLVDVASGLATGIGITFNPSKCEAMFIPAKRNRVPELKTISVSGNDIPYVRKARYLGHLITDDGRQVEDVKRAVRALYGAFNGGVRKHGRSTLANRLVLFQGLCTHLFGAECWLGDTDLRPIQRAYDNCLKSCLGLSKYMSTTMASIESQILPFNLVYSVRHWGFVLRLARSRNSCVRAMLASSTSIVATSAAVNRLFLEAPVVWRPRNRDDLDRVAWGIVHRKAARLMDFA
jgi:exonuclease III